MNTSPQWYRCVSYNRYGSYNRSLIYSHKHFLTHDSNVTAWETDVSLRRAGGEKKNLFKFLSLKSVEQCFMYEYFKEITFLFNFFFLHVLGTRMLISTRFLLAGITFGCICCLLHCYRRQFYINLHARQVKTCKNKVY